jgi:hypothetical protein
MLRHLAIIAGLACSAAWAADPAASATFKIPSQNNFSQDFRVRQPGDTLVIKVEADAGFKILTGAVDNASSQGWTGGPTTFTGVIPGDFSGVHTGKFKGTYAPTGGGEGKGPGEPPPWKGDAKAQVATLTTQTVATTPADRTRTTIGVDEEVDVATKPAVNVKWSVEGGGAVAPAEGMTTRFTAPDAGATCKVIATYPDGRKSSIEYSVIPPNDAAFTAAAPFFHTKGFPSSGFTGTPIVIQPTTVSFYNIESREGKAKVTSDGVFAGFNGVEHPNGIYVTITEANRLNGSDEVRTKGSNVVVGGDFSGKLTWPIPWLYHKKGAAGLAGTTYATLTHEAVSDKAGKTTQSKGGASKTFALNDDTTP